MADATSQVPEITFHRHPETYKHWKLTIDGDIARLAMSVQEDGGLREDTVLKLNSYDLGVDLELSDVYQRMRFEHPEVRCIVIEGALPRVFCAGANIPMLRTSSHSFKVNFCKYTNETRLYIEDVSEASGVKTLCAVNGTASGGGYELALAADWITMTADGNTAVSFPEVPLLGVLPGTGGLTRLVDKRKVRRDRADVFSTLAEGIKGPRAEEWKLVDEVVPSSQFADAVERRARILADEAAEARPDREGQGVVLPEITHERDGGRYAWKYVTMDVDASKRVAEILVRGPESAPTGTDDIRAQGAEWWALRCFRELDQALLQLRFNQLQVGLVVMRTEGDPAKVLATDFAIGEHGSDWFVCEVKHHIKRVLKRLDLTARSLFAIVEPGNCFVGTLFELCLAADRIYMLDDEEIWEDEGGVRNTVQMSELNGGAYPMSNGLSRLRTHFIGEEHDIERALSHAGPFNAQQADNCGLVTYAPDDIDWEDEVRIAIEERASLSPDALTGMEASLRFAGPETMETKIFGRLSAWQNWIFQRPNAVGERGALTCYGQPQMPVFDYTRT
jgi:benzoyl-CoA-dihydrodiol lyase